MSRFAKNQINLIFRFHQKNRHIVDETINQSIQIAKQFNTLILIELFNENSEKIKMEMYNNLGANEYFSNDFFKFYGKFLNYTNEVEAKYDFFVTLPMD